MAGRGCNNNRCHQDFISTIRRKYFSSTESRRILSTRQKGFGLLSKHSKVWWIQIQVPVSLQIPCVTQIAMIVLDVKMIAMMIAMVIAVIIAMIIAVKIAMIMKWKGRSTKCQMSLWLLWLLWWAIFCYKNVRSWEFPELAGKNASLNFWSAFASNYFAAILKDDGTLLKMNVITLI